MNTRNVLIVMLTGLLSVASICQAAEDTWTRKADMPTARSALSASVVDGKIYAIGGGPGQDVPTTIVERYDPETDSWTTKSSMHTPRAFFGTTTANGRIYAIGGYSSGGAYLASLEGYDPATDTWRPGAEMLTKRAWLCVDTVDGIIYAIGGVIPIDSPPYGQTLTTIEAYDPLTDTWMPKADMPTQRGGAAAASVDGKIYVIGGAIGNLHVHPTSIVEVYDPTTDTWTRKADMPTARMILAVSVVCGKIYAIGGYDYLGPVYPMVEVYDPATDTWTNIPDMQFRRKALASAAVNGNIYAMGGHPIAAGWDAPISVVEEYDLNPSPDFNGDGLVNIKDLLRLIESWNQDDTMVDLAPPPCGDGIVDAHDVEVMMRYWGQDDTFIAHWKLDETGGEIAYDSVGENHARVMGDPTWQRENGQIDGALEFDGIDDYITAPCVIDLEPNAFSIFAWISGGVPGQVILSQAYFSDWLLIDPQDDTLMTDFRFAGMSDPPLDSQVVVTHDGWHRVGLVWDGIHRILYFDDMEVACDTIDTSVLLGDLQIGADSMLESGSFWSGLIDDVRIYKRAVTP